MMNPIDRRSLIRAGLGAGALLAAGPEALALSRRLGRPTLRPDVKTKHVVLIAMAGGVRTRETFGTPNQIPNLVRMAREGVSYTRLRTGNLGHFGASMSIITGISEQRGIRDNARPLDPTLFEYVRKDLALPASDVWVTTSGGAQQVNYSFGLHADYGARYGATTLDGDGIFNEEFKSLMRQFGLPEPLDEAERKRVARLRRAMGGKDTDQGKVAARSRVESYILSELGRGVTALRGPGASDAKALRLARNLLSVFKPRLIGVVLQDADVAHGSFNGYQEVIRRNDAAIGELMDAIRSDETLRDSTTVCVLPEFGRDSDLNTRRGLDHGDGSDDLRYVQGVLWGPDFKKGTVLKDEQRTIDVTPTIAHLFGVNPKYAKGSILRGALA